MAFKAQRKCRHEIVMSGSRVGMEEGCGEERGGGGGGEFISVSDKK